MAHGLSQIGKDHRGVSFNSSFLTINSVNAQNPKITVVKDTNVSVVKG